MLIRGPGLVYLCATAVGGEQFVQSIAINEEEGGADMNEEERGT